MAKRTISGRFKKGASGNPGGRPKVDTSLRDLARAHTAEAVEALLSIMRSKKTSATARVSAAVALLDRGHGKPMQSLDHQGEINVNERETPKLEAARRICFQAELIARDIEKKRPDLAPVDRKLVMEKVVAEFVAGAQKEPLDPKTRAR